MNIKSAILRIFEFHRGQPISGALLAQKLAVSRNAIWKAVKELQKEGYLIEGIHRQGYSFSPTNDILSKEGILPYLDEEKWIDNVQVYKSLDSTNNLAKKLALEEAPHGTVILAETQTKGRGRKGRSFFSPEAKGIYMSVILRPKLRMEQALWMTSAAAVLTAQAIESILPCYVQIKWVNDLFISDKKIGGILTEAATNWESGEVQYIIVGLGINVTPPKDGFPDELQPIVGTLFTEGEKPVQRNVLVAKIINNIMKFSTYLEDDINALQKKIMAQYRCRSCVINRQVKIIDYPGLESGIVKDVDDQGFLIVEDTKGQTHVLSSGEITLRPIE